MQNAHADVKKKETNGNLNLCKEIVVKIKELSSWLENVLLIRDERREVEEGAGTRRAIHQAGVRKTLSQTHPLAGRA